MSKLLLIFLALLTFNSCNEGLAPPIKPIIPIIKGTVYFKGQWPNKDSITDLRVAFFKKLPDTNLILDYINKNLFFPDSSLKPYLSDSVSYFLDFNNTTITIPIDLKYAAVVYNKGSYFVQTDWKVVSIYTEDTLKFTPKAIKLDGTKKEVFINFIVNWDNYPPQPF